jgi:hypothetical protein
MSPCAISAEDFSTDSLIQQSSRPITSSTLHSNREAIPRSKKRLPGAGVRNQRRRLFDEKRDDEATIALT